jgi:HAMP domain-containing protein
MSMKLRPKVLSGFFILALMLSAAGVWSIYEFGSISSSVKGILDDNYRSINAAKMMLEALEREDSGILLLVAGEWREGRKIVVSADSSFGEGFRIASNNITIPGERAYVAAIDSTYQTYKRIWERPIVETRKQGNLSWYFPTVHQAFLGVKSAVNGLMFLNDEVMFRTAMNMKQKANRAVMPGIVAILAALVFSLMFSYFMNFYVVSPIVRITNGIKGMIDEGTDFDIQPESKDEISDLAEAIRTLISRIS